MTYLDLYKTAYAEAIADIIGVLHDVHEASEPDKLHRTIAEVARCDAAHDILIEAYKLVGVNAVRTSAEVS